MKGLDELIKRAQTASTEALWEIIRYDRPEVISNATLNKNLTKEMAIFIAKKRSTPSEVLGFLAHDVRFKDSYKLKIAICRNPKSPQKITLSLLKFLRIFDLSDLTRMQHLPVNIRQKIEHDISQRIPAMPMGIKTALARRANGKIVMMLIEKGDNKVINTCLDSPVLTEGHLYTIINKETTKPPVIHMIAQHPKWSLRYDVRFALIRNFHTPMKYVTGFIEGMKTRDLKELYIDSKVPTSTKPFIFRELRERGETEEPYHEEVFEISEDEDGQLSDTWMDGE